MSNQFYITLPSNTEKGSTASNFRVTVPQRIKLDGSWEVGLAEIIYPNSWHNLTDTGENNVIELGIQLSLGDPIRAKKVYIRPDYYKTVDQLLESISETIKKKLEGSLKDSFKINYTSLPLIAMGVDTEFIKYVRLGEQLAYMLGFHQRFYDFSTDGQKKVIVFDNFIDSDTAKQYRARRHNFKNNIMSTMYIYCSIVEDQIIGNSVAPLLRIVDVQGEYGDIISRMYDNPHFVPLLVKDISSIEINIKDDMDQFITFAFGKVVVKLVFRKRSHYFD